MPHLRLMVFFRAPFRGHAGFELIFCVAALNSPFASSRPGQQRAVERGVDLLAFLAPRRFQHVVHDFVAIARMADADPQPPVILGAEMRGDVLEAVVTAQAATELEPHLARRDVEFVMHHQHFGRLDAIETRQRLHRLAGTVHEGLRHQQPEVRAGDARLADQAVVARFAAEGCAEFARQALTKPKPGVVPGFSVFGPGVAEPDDQAQCGLQALSACRRARPSSPAWPEPPATTAAERLRLPRPRRRPS
jgi:hypothetical protein